MRLLPALLIAFSLSAFAEPSSVARMSGSTLDGQRFNLETLRGRVVMLFFWNTDCAPCLQKMPELRANAAGWRGKPFELVLVSTDRDRAAALSYLQTLKTIERNAPPMPALWLGDLNLSGVLAAPAAVPLTVVLDAKGAVVARHAGRIAPEAWDDVAALLP